MHSEAANLGAAVRKNVARLTTPQGRPEEENRSRKRKSRAELAGRKTLYTKCLRHKLSPRRVYFVTNCDLY